MKTGTPSHDWADFKESQTRMEIFGDSWELNDQTKLDLDRQYYFAKHIKPFLHKINE